MGWAAGQFLHQVAATCSTHTGSAVHPSPQPDRVSSACCCNTYFCSEQGWQLTLSCPGTGFLLSDSDSNRQCRPLLAHMRTRLATIPLAKVSWLQTRYQTLGYPTRLLLRITDYPFCEHYPDSQLPHDHRSNTPYTFVSVE